MPRRISIPSWGRKRKRTSQRSGTALLGPVRRNPYQVRTRYVPHRTQEVIHSLSNATVVAGTKGYGWHLNEIPIGASFDDRHSDKVRIHSFEFKMQFRDGYKGYDSNSVHNVYVYLVRDNSGGAKVPDFDSICLMDNSNIATAVVDHDNKDRFTISRRWKNTFTGGCSKNGTYAQAYKDRIDFNKRVKVNQITEFKGATDGKYANTQKNAWVLYLLGQVYDYLVDGHVKVRFESIV
uniref:V1 n=1 Tax=Bindweed mottle virus TaxID=3076663 RepID=A0AA96C7N6_9GEMI|nr:V1 [Bindweed mottle virus]